MYIVYYVYNYVLAKYFSTAERNDEEENGPA